MKAHEFMSETMRVGHYKNLGTKLPVFAGSEMEHIGDFDGYRILKKQITDTKFWVVMFDDLTPALAMQCNMLTECSRQFVEIQVAYVYPGYSGRKLFERGLFFLKSIEKYNVMIDNHVSAAALSSLEKIFQTKRFAMQWLDTATGECVPYSPEQVGDFVDYVNVTKWRLILEQSPSYSLPRFQSDDDYKTWFTIFEDDEDNAQ